MTNIGIYETIFLVIICVVSFVIPVVLLILGYLIYNKVDRIEEMIKSKE